jgi:hypothetical protein
LSSPEPLTPADVARTFLGRLNTFRAKAPGLTAFGMALWLAIAVADPFLRAAINLNHHRTLPACLFMLAASAAGVSFFSFTSLFAQALDENRSLRVQLKMLDPDVD